MSSSLTLARLETAVLEAAWRALDSLPAKTRVLEVHLSDEQLRGALAPLLGQPAWVVASMLEAVLGERGSFSEKVDPPEAAEGTISALEQAPVHAVEYRMERRFGTTSPELVWSGPTGGRSCARLTRHVIEDLFSGVRSRVFIAGYSFDGARDLFDPLFERMTLVQGRGEDLPRVRVVLDCSRTKCLPDDTPATIAERTAKKFLETCWVEDFEPPSVAYYRPSAERTKNGFAAYSMHAKCIVVDDEKALVGSANFSQRGRDHRSLEAGALIRDHHFVQSLAAAWDAVSHELVPVQVAN